ncbi:uncharacterized protein LOC113208771 [Frankliniella occidentalis]|uniref:Uncharacterized protein LOC113208771 n=1 Tax=Frankliniella occidentalis TaxID=133901 RepID=A0A6J1SLA4_FRAOC|nr:uncharacterized protein LOC113208771 [Frankliniella occidentalis]
MQQTTVLAVAVVAILAVGLASAAQPDLPVPEGGLLRRLAPGPVPDGDLDLRRLAPRAVVPKGGPVPVAPPAPGKGPKPKGAKGDGDLEGAESVYGYPYGYYGYPYGYYGYPYAYGYPYGYSYGYYLG